MSLPSARACAISIFLLALLVRIPFFPTATLGHEPTKAASMVAYDGYFEIVENLRSGHGFSRDPEITHTPDSVRTPLYPLFIVGLLSLFGSYGALFIAQVLLGCLIALCAWMIAKEFFGNTWISFLVGIAIALEPMGAYLTGVILTETLFTFLFLVALWLFLVFLKKKHIGLLALFSLLLGIATLVKPSTQYLPVVCILVFFFLEKYQLTKKFFLYSGTLLVLFGAVISPWLYRNHLVFGNASLAVQPVSNMFTFLVPSTIALEEGISFEQAKHTFFTQEGAHDIEEINLGNAAGYKKKAIAELTKRPVGLMKSVGITLYAFFMNDGYATAFSRLFNTQEVPSLHVLSPLLLIVLAGRAFWIGITLLALAGAWLLFKKEGLSARLIFIVCTIGYFALTTAVIGLAVNGRFRIPVNPLLFILAALTLQNLISRIGISKASREQ